MWQRLLAVLVVRHLAGPGVDAVEAGVRVLVDRRDQQVRGLVRGHPVALADDVPRTDDVAARRELERVAHEIDENLPSSRRIAENGARRAHGIIDE